MKNEQPAFPTELWDGDTDKQYGQALGMSLRDYFAGQALEGYQAHPGNACNLKHVADWCYQLADEMIKARGEL